MNDILFCRQQSSDERSSRSEEHTSELQSHSDLVCRLLLVKMSSPARHRPPQSIHKRNRWHARPDTVPRPPYLPDVTSAASVYCLRSLRSPPRQWRLSFSTENNRERWR